MRSALKSLLMMLVFVAAFASAQSQKKPPLTNEDIVRMVKGKFADSTIVKAIEANDTAFDVSVSALFTLKNSGVSQTVIEAMLSAANPKGTTSATQAGATADIEDIRKKEDEFFAKSKEKQPLEQKPADKAGPSISLDAGKWDTAEIKECTTYANKPFRLFCDDYQVTSPDYNAGFYQVKFSGDELLQQLYLVDDPWPDLTAVDSALHRSQMDLPEKMTVWKCSKDSKGITCNFSGTADPLLEKKKPAQ